MADTFIKYNSNKGFWIKETFIQLAFQFILIELIKPTYNFSNKSDLIEDALDIINGHNKGFVGLNWEEYLENSSEEQLMVQLLQNVINNLQSQGSYISTSVVKSMSSEDEYWKSIFTKQPFPIAELLRILNAIVQLLQNTWTYTNYSMDINWE